MWTQHGGNDISCWYIFCIWWLHDKNPKHIPHLYILNFWYCLCNHLYCLHNQKAYVSNIKFQDIQMWDMLRVFVMQLPYTKNISTWYIIISTLWERAFSRGALTVTHPSACTFEQLYTQFNCGWWMVEGYLPRPKRWFDWVLWRQALSWWSVQWSTSLWWGTGEPGFYGRNLSWHWFRLWPLIIHKYDAMHVCMLGMQLSPPIQQVTCNLWVTCYELPVKNEYL